MLRVDVTRDVLAERRLVHRVLVAIAILVPIGAVTFALLMLAATSLAGAPEGGPIAMGAATGVLVGLFFGMWAGVVASARDIDHTDDPSSH